MKSYIEQSRLETFSKVTDIDSSHDVTYEISPQKKDFFIPWLICD